MAKSNLNKPKITRLIKKQVQQKRTYFKQADVSMMSLDDALRVPQTILDNYVGKPTSPLYEAKR